MSRMQTLPGEYPVEPAEAGLPITYGRLGQFPDDPIACMRRLHATHGNIAALQEDSQRIIFVFGPKYNQQVLSETTAFHSRFFLVRGPRNSSQRRLTCGLLSMNGHEHKQHRRMVMGPFQKTMIANYHEPVRQLTGELLDEWAAPAHRVQVRDVHADMTQYMLRVTSGILFGLENPELAYHLGAMIDRWVAMNHETGIGAFISDHTLTNNYSRLLHLAEQLEADLRTMIQLRRSSRQQGHDVLSLLIRAHEEEGRVNDDELIGHVALLFGAAHLTTAHTLTWTLFLLAQHPPVMRDVLDELAGRENRHPSLIERVIRESMRVLPASSYSQRIAAEPVRLGPFALPRGTPVVFSQFITHRMPELYPEPERFQPDRWREIVPSPYAYLPFGAGSRMCLGSSLAMMILNTALPMILRRYRLTVVPGAEINGKVISTMLGPTTSVPVQVWPQDGHFQSSPVTGNIHDLVDLPEASSTGRSENHRAA